MRGLKIGPQSTKSKQLAMDAEAKRRRRMAEVPGEREKRGGIRRIGRRQPRVEVPSLALDARC